MTMRNKTAYRWLTLFLAILMLGVITQGLWAQEATPQVSDDDCMLGAGFWANHPEAWAVTSLTLGSQSYTQAELIAILSGGGDGDASLILARQLIAAKLNAASGVVSAVADGLISAGDALLIGFSGKLPYNVEPSSAAGQSMTALGTTLDSFNVGDDDDDDDCNATPTPEATVEATVEATAEITPEATVEATPEITPVVTPENCTNNDDDDCDGLEITIIIEGPVQEINANIIVIYGFHIEVDPTDPILVIIQVGDIVRIEGNVSDDDDDDDDTNITIVIIAVIVVIVDVDVVVGGDGSVWRDNGNCQNPPPPWAPANGWRRRCERGNNGNGNGNGGSGGSGGS